MGTLRGVERGGCQGTAQQRRARTGGEETDSGPSVEREAGALPEKKGGPRPEDTVEEGRLRMAVAALGPLSGYFILVNPQQWEGVRCCSAGRSAKERAGCLEPR